MKSMTFNGRRYNRIYLLEGRRKAPFAPITRNVRSTRKQNYHQSSRRQPLLISQPIGHLFDDDLDALKIKDDLAEWLVTEDIAPLEFDDEPGRTYWSVVQNTIDDYERFAYLKRGTIEFLCFYTTGLESLISVTTQTHYHTITGQDKTPWEIEVLFEENTSRFEFWAGDIYLQLNHEFISGDRLNVKYEGRKVTLNGNDLRTAVSMTSNYEELKPGIVGMRASHPCTLKYTERYY